MEIFQEGLTDDVVRRVIWSLLLTTELNSGFWRDPLVDALMAADAGEVNSLFTPSKTRLRGQPYPLDKARSGAVAHVYYLVGKGIKKHIARERTADALAVSEDTLKDWEQALQKYDYFAFNWDGAYLVGELEEEIKKGMSYNGLLEEYGAEWLGPASDVAVACHFIKTKEGELGLESIRAALRKYHDRSSKDESGD